MLPLAFLLPPRALRVCSWVTPVRVTMSVQSVSVTLEGSQVPPSQPLAMLFHATSSPEKNDLSCSIVGWSPGVYLSGAEL